MSSGTRSLSRVSRHTKFLRQQRRNPAGPAAGPPAPVRARIASHRESVARLPRRQRRHVGNKMAKKRKIKAAKKAMAAQPQRLPIRVIVDAPDELAVYYANYAEASAGHHECLISFARVPTKLSVARTEEAKGGTLRLEPLVQVMIPPTLLPGLIRALSITKEGYEKLVGLIHDPDAPK